jgi:hypothetical protein
MMRWMRWMVLGLLLAVPGYAVVPPTVFDGTRHTDGLLAFQTITGAGANMVCTGLLSKLADGTAVCKGGFFRGIVFTINNTAGSATVEIDINCNNAGWAPVQNSSMTVTGPGNAAVSIRDPQCMYEANITAISGGGTVTVTYDTGVPVK